jgi:hypothetical protein
MNIVWLDVRYALRMLAMRSVAPFHPSARAESARLHVCNCAPSHSCIAKQISAAQ